ARGGERRDRRQSECVPSLVCLSYLNQPDALETGSVTRKRVPLWGPLLTSIWPSCASTIFLTIASPSPEPCGLVVKNGLKIRSVRSGGTPGPLSATSTISVGVGVDGGPKAGSSSRTPSVAPIVTRPRPSSASKAFATRFVNT